MYSKLIETQVCNNRGHMLTHVSPGVSAFVVFCSSCGLLLDLDEPKPIPPKNSKTRKKAKKGA